MLKSGKHMSILITGVAGFIGFHLARNMLENGNHVVGIDNLNNYYDVQLKKDRLNLLQSFQNFTFYKEDLINQKPIVEICKTNQQIEYVIHLAQQPGVRYSIINPHSYIDNNITATLNFLEAVRNLKHLKNFIFASSSSVYGKEAKLPSSVLDATNTPSSFYATSKIASEAMCYNYHHLYNINMTILRFFTVYGPWGRPDMALYSFASAIMEGKPIKLYNNGNLKRDFTYIDDIIAGINNIICYNNYNYKVYNLGNHKSEELLKFVQILENSLGEKAIIELAPMQDGDMYETFADITESKQDFQFNPVTSIEDGIPKFASWFLKYKNYAKC